MPNNEWQTPPEFLELVREFYDGQIDLDPASNAVAQRSVNALEYCSLEEGKDGLLSPWGGRKVFCNPPYSTGSIDAFAHKSIEEFYNDAEIILLVNSSTDTKWYHQLLSASAVVLLWRGRIKFWKIYNDQSYSSWATGSGKIGNSPRYLNTVFYLGKNVDKFISVFQNCGTLLKKV